MLATLQGFPMNWPFKGGRSPHFKQIANALPLVVAMHLGCSVAAALTGEPQDYRRETIRLATSRRLSPVPRSAAPTPAAPHELPARHPVPGAVASSGRLDLRELRRATQSGHDEPAAYDLTDRTVVWSPPQPILTEGNAGALELRGEV